MRGASSAAQAKARADLLAGYAGQQIGNSDEMLGPGGAVRPVWSAFIDHLSRLGEEERTKRFARGNQYLRDAGVLYRQYDETLSSEREWPLSHIPVIVEEAEWQTISAALIERADLLEYVLRDFYGDNTLVSSGQLPATLLSKNPAWLRPMVGANAGDGDLLNFVSFELGRGPDGNWWVISDLIETPSTAGFAVENRMAMSRVFPNFFAKANVHRLAGFFQDFQDRLFGLRGRGRGEIALMTPGPMNQNHPEHAYIARYLGLLLVEGEDLVVQNGRAMVRTVAGMRPISLLWNRIPSNMIDPLELDAYSMLGTPGLLGAIRSGGLHSLNAVGAGVLETRALMAFLPKIARAHLGRDLAMPNIATWWCGDPKARDHVLSNRTRMMLGSAFSTVPMMADPATSLPVDSAMDLQGDRIAQLLQHPAPDLVGQEAVTLSTTPVWENGELAARPMSMRIFLGRNRDGWQVMPGGYARVSAGNDAKALAMQHGGRVADVWIVSPGPVAKPSMIARDAPARGNGSSALPSRAADNMFWLGRYVERSELNMRLFRAYFARVGDGAPQDAGLLAYLRAQVMDRVAPDITSIAARFSEPLTLALQSATRISDRFSPDGMMALRGLVAQMQAGEERQVPLDEVSREISGLLRGITGFAGLVHESMYRSDGWRFLSLGLSLERAASTCHILAALTADAAPAGALDLALEVGDSVVSHRARHSIISGRSTVVDMLGLDANNPRAVHYHIDRAMRHIKELPGHATGQPLTEAARQALLLQTRLATSDAEMLTPNALLEIRGAIWALSDALRTTHLG